MFIIFFCRINWTVFFWWVLFSNGHKEKKTSNLKMEALKGFKIKLTRGIHLHTWRNVFPRIDSTLERLCAKKFQKMMQNRESLGRFPRGNIGHIFEVY